MFDKLLSILSKIGDVCACMFMFVVSASLVQHMLTTHIITFRKGMEWMEWLLWIGLGSLMCKAYYYLAKK